jgi:multicomponent Na+:H+ antiporter subunit G
MSEALYWIGGGLTLLGALLTVVGAAGVLRFPDVYTRIHAASITDTGGATLMLLGLGLVSGLSLVTLKLLIVWAFIMLTSPAAAHALANAAFASGLTPWIGEFRIMKGSAPNVKQTGTAQ